GLLGTFAPDLALLVVARVLLGFGTCSGYPAAMFLIRSEAKRTGHDSPAIVLTALAVSSQTIAVIGPTLGGLLIGLSGWRATLAVDIPPSVLGLVLGSILLPRPPVTARADRARLDLPGIAAFAALLTALLLFLMNPAASNAYLLALAAAAAAAFVWWELRATEPFIDVRVLGGNVPLLATYLRN